MSRYMGSLLAYIIGSYVDYIYVPIIFVFIPTMFAIIFIFFPNTTQYYLRKNQRSVSDNICEPLLPPLPPCCPLYTALLPL